MNVRRRLPLVSLAVLLFGCDAQEKQHFEQLGSKLRQRGTSLLPTVRQTLDGTWATLQPGTSRSSTTAPRNQVQARLQTDKLLQDAQIEVAAEGDGTIVLRGQVEDDTRRLRAKILAETTLGVKAVRDELVITPTNGSLP